MFWKSPWAFDHNLVILRPIGKQDDPLEINLDVCELYVQVKGIPLFGKILGLAKIIGGDIGTFVALDEDFNEGKVSTSMGIRVLIDITQPLWWCLMIEGPRNQPIQLNVTYEKLPNLFVIVVF